MLDYALESLDNLRPGDCVVCFSKNDIYSVSRQIEARGLECAVIYGSLPPGELPPPFEGNVLLLSAFLEKLLKLSSTSFPGFVFCIIRESNQLSLTGVLILGLDLYYVLNIDLQTDVIK